MNIELDKEDLYKVGPRDRKEVLGGEQIVVSVNGYSISDSYDLDLSVAQLLKILRRRGQRILSDCCVDILIKTSGKGKFIEIKGFIRSIKLTEV